MILPININEGDTITIIPSVNPKIEVSIKAKKAKKHINKLSDGRYWVLVTSQDTKWQANFLVEIKRKKVWLRYPTHTEVEALSWFAKEPIPQ